MHLRERLIQELNEARAKMREVAERTGENNEIYNSWKIKEVLAHITGWDNATIDALSAHSAGHVPDTPARRGIDVYNAESVSKCEKLSYTEIVREWEDTRVRLIEILHTMPDEKFDQPLVFPWGPSGSVAKIVGIMIHHEHEHADEISEQFQLSA